MESLGNILYSCTLLHIICEHLHDLYTLNSLSGKIQTERFPKFPSNIYSILYIIGKPCSFNKADKEQTGLCPVTR